jgi:hypothetical protein
MNAKILIAVGVVGLAAAGGGGWFFMGRDTGPSPEEVAAAKEAEAKLFWKKNEEMHKISVFSYVQPASGGYSNRAVPFVVHLDVKGGDAVDALCNSMPRVKETLLRVFGTAIGGHSRDRGAELARFCYPLQQALNAQLGGRAITRVDAAMLVDAGRAGAAARETDQKCREYTES